ncbi:AAA family ATPase [Streptomyces kaniharaensis]|uniref:AAA family ATPase n=1 Tax=Streptomyces kaniharaensis TaxID=212423 RepID=A0A6N7KJT0_9ACTN|nr:TniB family NTP-binding protein [Streptomyces kaniharaensis]MQS10995.1 AAA family ATPase [Streptomyces kaniharaensis]
MVRTGDDELDFQPLVTREGWRAFADAPRPEAPTLLPEAAWLGLDPLERDAYDRARMTHHMRLLVVATPAIRHITTTGRKLLAYNAPKATGRRGLIVSGPSGTGKSTAVQQLGKKYHVDTMRQANPHSDRIPVAYIVVPSGATPKMLSIELASFLGLPIRPRASQHEITNAVCTVLRKVRCGMVIVDEIHNLDLSTRAGAEASDQLKYFYEQIRATFVYAGIDVAEHGLFSGLRGRQIAGRFLTIHTSAFGDNGAEERSDWKKIIATMEQALRLHRHAPGSLVRLAPYLQERSAGSIGALDQLIHQAANDAITDGTERITKRHLDEILLDTASQGEPWALPAPQGRPGRKAAS